MTWPNFGRWFRRRSLRGGVHRPGAVRQGIDATPELAAELEEARRRLADVNALAPHVAAREHRASFWLRNNHLGPMFDDAFGLRPNHERRA